jgi:3',5'-cyclic AMP phosphodiesterase CpdA
MDGDFVRVAQFSDLHLVGKPGTTCKGIDTWAQLERMLLDLKAQEPVHALVLTGDIAHDEKLSTYEQLREILEEYSLPYWVIPGNHDSPGLIREVFWDRVEANTTSACFCTTIHGYGLIGLDTHEPGCDGGLLSEASTDWFKEQLVKFKDTSVLVFMHHPPLDTGDTFFDSIGLRNRREWFEMAKSYQQIQGIGYGHLHRTMTLCERPRVQGAPSTAFGMTLEAGKFLPLKEGAGYLIWTLNRTGVNAEVLVGL